jgi:hypothetical protein
MKVHFGHATSGEVVVGKARHALPSAFGQKFDRGVGGVHELGKARRGIVMVGA